MVVGDRNMIGVVVETIDGGSTDSIGGFLEFEFLQELLGLQTTIFANAGQYRQRDVVLFFLSFPYELFEPLHNRGSWGVLVDSSVDCCHGAELVECDGCFGAYWKDGSWLSRLYCSARARKG